MGGRISPPKVPLAPGNCAFLFSAWIWNLSKCPRPVLGQTGLKISKSRFPACGGLDGKKLWNFEQPDVFLKTVPSTRRLCFFLFSARAGNLSKCPRPVLPQNGLKPHSYPVKVKNTDENPDAKRLAKPNPDNVLTFFSVEIDKKTLQHFLPNALLLALLATQWLSRWKDFNYYCLLALLADL